MEIAKVLKHLVGKIGFEPSIESGTTKANIISLTQKGLVAGDQFAGHKHPNTFKLSAIILAPWHFQNGSRFAVCCFLNPFSHISICYRARLPKRFAI